MTGGYTDGDVSSEEAGGNPSGRVGKAERYRVDGDVDAAERPDDGELWEVFQRDDDGRPMRHVGRVRAEDADAAHEHASRLFAWYAPEVWICPAAAVTRFSTAGGADDEPATPPSGDEERTIEF